MSNINGSHWIRPEKRLAIYMRDSFSCAYCQADLRNAEPRQVTLDHLEPRVTGGTNDAENLVMACLSCNSARRDTPWQQFAVKVGAMSDVRRIRWLVSNVLNIYLARSIIDGRGDQIEEAR